LAVSDPEALAELEAQILDFPRFVLGLAPSGPNNAAAYSNSPGYKTLVQVIESDLAETKARDRMAGIGLGFAHRLFDARWLESEHFRFRLVGVVNRLDRRVFAPEYCGEVRFIYRLAYEKRGASRELDSRVPMTLNVVRWLPGGDCREHVERFRAVADRGRALAGQLLASSGPLSSAALARTHLKSIEVDMQSERWPATVRPNMTGHAEYVLRVFRPDGDSWRPATLENTPDVARLKAKPALLEEFVEWLKRPESLEAIDEGTVVVPERFLGKRTVSVAPHGLARLANRPYRELFQKSDGDGLSLSGYRTFASFEQLVRRLDGLTCMGCHQTKSLAGFHFLGADDPDREVDALKVPFSPHFSDELARRERYLARLLEGGAPDELRLPPERMAGGGYGEHCGLHRTFEAWDCDPGLRCVKLHDDQVGQCMPVESQLGDACETGSMRSSANAHRDYLALDKPSSCGSPARHCERSAVGFPSGMCSSGCGNLPGEATCGAIALLTEFNACLARRVPFDTCVRENTRPGALRSCSAGKPCREDYVCARLPSGEGGCIPPYFLFQLRVDGHVL
jgi:hypothetical protein